MSTAVRSVVWVADDLGVSAGTNAGIAQVASGVREASLCVTGGAVEAGAALADGLGVGVGLHLSFSLGHALTGPLRGLTDTEGRFHGLHRTLTACLLRTVVRSEIEREVEAQFARLRDLVAKPTHVNGHHHVHVFPVIRDVVFSAAARHGIAWTRMPREHSAAGGPRKLARSILAQLAAGATRRAHAAGLRWLPFVGISTENRLDFAVRCQRILERLPAGSYEWMVHPRIPDPALSIWDPRAAGNDATAAAELEGLGVLASEAGCRFANVQPVRVANQ